MKAILNAALIILVCALSPSLSAQWPTYPTWPVPKTAGGEPNLAAPAPRTADGKPDFSGVWRGAPAGQRGAPPPATPPTGPPLAERPAQVVCRGELPDGLPALWGGGAGKTEGSQQQKNPEALRLDRAISHPGAPRKFLQLLV
jgi:hypothetical protein